MIKCNFTHMPVHLLGEHRTPSSVFFLHSVTVHNFQMMWNKDVALQRLLCQQVTLCRISGPDPANNISPIVQGCAEQSPPVLKSISVHQALHMKLAQSLFLASYLVSPGEKTNPAVSKQALMALFFQQVIRTESSSAVRQTMPHRTVLSVNSFLVPKYEATVKLTVQPLPVLRDH